MGEGRGREGVILAMVCYIALPGDPGDALSLPKNPKP
jgi:hypothetical protein